MNEERTYRLSNVGYSNQEDNLTQLKGAINDFILEKSKNSHENIQNSYIHLLTVFESFLVEESNQKLISDFSSKIAELIYNFIPAICQSLIFLVQTLRILPKIDQFSKINPPSNIFNLFVTSCDFAVQQKQILKIAINYFRLVFTNQEFVRKFVVDGSGLHLLLNELVCRQIVPEMEEICDLLIENLTVLDKQSIYFDLFRDFVSLFNAKKIRPENAFYSSLFISRIFHKVTYFKIADATQTFANIGVFKVIYQIFKKINENQIAQIINIFLTSLDDTTKKQPNLIFCHWLSQICVQSPVIQDISFKLLIPYISNSAASLKEINEVFSLLLWLTDFKRPLNESIEIVHYVDKYCPEITINFLPTLLQITNALYEDVFNIILSQIQTKKITPSSLSEIGFLETFIINNDSLNLPKLFCDQNFYDVALNVFLQSAFLQPQVLLALLRNDTLFEISSNFLCLSPSLQNIKAILNEHSSKIYELFLITFERSIDVCTNFIVAGGLQWLNEIDFSYFVQLLGSLVSQRRFPEVDKFISSLPTTHPLFSLS